MVKFISRRRAAGSQQTSRARPCADRECAADKSSRPVVAGRLEEARQLIDCMDRCSQSPDQERPCPAIRSVERSVSPIVIAVSAQGQLIALLELADMPLRRIPRCQEFCRTRPKTSAEPGDPA